MKIIVTSFKRSRACTTTLSTRNSAAGHCRPTPPPETPGHTWASLGQSLGGHCPFLLGPGAHKVLFVPSKSVSPVLCKFWRLWWVNGDLLQEGLCRTQVCSTQSTSPCGSPLLTRTSTGDAQTQFWLSLCGLSGSWCTQGLFESSECLWCECGLILNMISPLLPSCWGFFALGCGESFLSGIQYSPVNGCSEARETHGF